MITFTDAEWMRMQEALQEVAMTSEDNLQMAERSYEVAETYLQKIKEFILSYDFKDPQEEILFFKEIKPKFLKELIFYMKVFYIEAGKPLGDRDTQVNYYKQGIVRINNYLERNHLLYIYYRMGSSDKDTQYFIRSSERSEVLPEYLLDMDPKFCTAHSYKFAKMQAYEMLNDYLLSAIQAINNPASSNDASALKTRPDATWTDPKVDLIELGYAIYCRGSVNHGKTDIKLIMSALEYAFNISLGHFYAVFQQNIRIRKKNRTVYLDSAKDHLERRMDDWDERP